MISREQFRIFVTSFRLMFIDSSLKFKKNKESNRTKIGCWIKIVNWLVHAKFINYWITEKVMIFFKSDEFVQLGRKGLILKNFSDNWQSKYFSSKAKQTWRSEFTTTSIKSCKGIRSDVVEVLLLLFYKVIQHSIAPKSFRYI